MQGKTINGYTLQRLLGTGGMAEVWYAENKIHKPAAVKILSTDLAHNASIIERFQNEAEVMVKLNHPNIRQVYDFGDIDGRPAIIMEYLDGSDLKARMKRGQHFTEEELERWWNQLVDALNYTHGQGIVHRDIKPGNIFVDRQGNIKLLDFGIAKVRESISSTQTGQKLGTLMYMSPEQVKDSKHIDYHTDIYSLAVTFVHLLTGKRPYDSDTSSDFEISEQIVYKPLDLSDVPKGWQGFLAPYLEKDPQKRPALRSFESVVRVEKPAKADDDDGTVVENVKQPKAKPVVQPTPKPQPKPDKPKAQTPEPSEKPKKKTGLWIGIGAAAAVLAVAVVLFLVLPKDGTNPNDKASTSKDALFMIIRDKVGFCDSSGKVVIEPQFEDARDFQESLAAVVIDGKWGFIDQSGKVVVEPKYNGVQGFNEGMAAVGISGDDRLWWDSYFDFEGVWGFVDKTGKEVIQPVYENVRFFHEGLAKVEINEKWGFIDKNGKRVVDLKYDFVDDFSEGFACVRMGEYFGCGWGFIDKSGNEVFGLDCCNAYNFSEGLAPVEIDDRWGYIDKSGVMVIPMEYEWAEPFHEGLAKVIVYGKYGFIDKKGNMVVYPKYDDAAEFNEGMAAVKLDYKWGYVDKEGNEVVAPKYGSAYGFSEGLAAVDNYGDDEFGNFYVEYGYIDKMGNEVIPLKFEYGENFVNGLALVKTDGKYCYIDKSGQVVFIRKNAEYYVE